MDWRIVGSTFVLIFVAELGDKTQLTAMASAAGSRATWSVFVGAAGALVLSTVIAVLLGGAFAKYMNPRAIQTVAGVLFLAFGVVALLSAYRGKALEPAAAAAAPARPGVLTRFVLDAAAEFEAASSVNFLDFAAMTQDARLRATLTELAIEDRCHLNRLRSLSDEHGEALLTTVAAAPVEMPAPDLSSLPENDRDVLKSAADHERAAADFYAELARSTSIPSLRTAFKQLADEERQHAQRLSVFASGSPTSDAAKS